LGVMWLTVERRRFKGPPTKERIAKFKEELAETQRTLAELKEKEATVSKAVDNDASALEQGDNDIVDLADYNAFVASLTKK
jgi:hypothetical protein